MSQDEYPKAYLYRQVVRAKLYIDANFAENIDLTGIASEAYFSRDITFCFYVNKLGFKVHTDAPMGPEARWLTVTPPDQPGPELTLIQISPGMMFNEQTAATMRELVQRGTFGFAVFECVDIYATYEELKAKGVEFKKPPTNEFYGIEALFSDDSGNWFTLGQKE